MEAAKQQRLLPLALLATHDGDSALARLAYFSLLQLAPWRVQNYIRLACTYLPSRVKHAVSYFLPTRYQCKLIGPPNDEPWLI